MKRATSLIVSLALVLALLPAPARAASSAYGSDVWLRDTRLQEGVTYSENIFWSSGYDKPRHEYFFTYTPGIGGGLPSAWSGTAGPPVWSGWGPDSGCCPTGRWGSGRAFCCASRRSGRS